MKNKKGVQTKTTLKNLITTANTEMDVLFAQAKNGIIDAGSASEKIEEIMKNRDLNILLEHSKYSDIWPASDGKHYRTYVPKPDGSRRLISIVGKENLEKAILKHYKELIIGNNTLESIYNRWREGRLSLAINSEDSSSKLGTLNKHDNIWRRYFIDTSFIKKDITTLTLGGIKDWIIQVNSKNSLTLRQFKEIRTLLRLLYEYAVEHEIVPINIPKQISTISGLTFREKTKDADLSEIERIERTIYTDETGSYLKEKSRERFNKTRNTAYLGISLNSNLGLRVGELVALRRGDINGNTIHICREEVAKRYVGDDGKIHRDGFEIVPHPKTETGNRYLPLSPESREIIDRIISVNESRGYNDENGFLFINTKGDRMHENSINNALAEVNGGRNKVDHNVKDHRPHGNHSLRKTCLSRLHYSNLPDDVIRSYAGHTDINTTRRCYITPVSTLESYADEIAKSLDFSNVNQN